MARFATAVGSSPRRMAATAPRLLLGGHAGYLRSKDQAQAAVPHSLLDLDVRVRQRDEPLCVATADAQDLADPVSGLRIGGIT